MEATVTCSAKFAANLAGVDLKVTGTAFLQQDARVGACAQVAIWAGLRHMHARYNSNWISVADITRLAAPKTSSEAAALPAGSDFLTSERMIRAISDAGFQPLCFRKRPGMEVGAAILPYVESGIPVILGLKGSGRIGHAVTVIGRVFVKLPCPTSRAMDYIAAYIVHDDRAGPYMWLGVDEDSSKRFPPASDEMSGHIGEDWLRMGVRKHGAFAVALMPTRVFSTAEAAEVTASTRLDVVFETYSQIRKELSEKNIDVDNDLMQELLAAHIDGQVVLRTYLTSASGYRRYVARSTANHELKNVLLSIHLPHFSWVTEIATRNSYNQDASAKRRIYGHTLLDATSTGRDGDGLLMLHIPGLIITKNVDARPGEEERATPIPDDRLYECRERGSLVGGTS